MRCGDDELKKHIEKSVGNGMYLSPVVQNELIGVCGKMIQADIVKRVNESVGYSVLADETSDIRNTEQLSICVRYVSNRALREDFLGLFPYQI